MRNKVSVKDLRFGMYVAELDRPWTDTPFLFQGFVLSNAQELDVLQRFCQHVFVDPERSDSSAGGLPTRQASPKAQPHAAVDRRPYPQKVSLDAEIARADYLHARTAKLLDEALRSLQGSDILDARRLRDAASMLTECVVRNPDALLLVNRLREKAESLVARALNVSIYMIVFGRFLERPREELEVLGLVGLLQDVGMIKLPPALLRKAGPLTTREHALARSHVQCSIEILRDVADLPAQVAETAALHHERIDGSGYPRGLKGAEIGLLGSIAGIADTFDALTTERAYAEPLPPSNALGQLHRQRGLAFDVDLVEQFIRCMGVFPVGSAVELNSGETGVVLSQNAVQRLKPQVMVIFDDAGNRLRPFKFLDLSREPKARPGVPYHITRTIGYERVRVAAHELFQ